MIEQLVLTSLLLQIGTVLTPLTTHPAIASPCT